MESMPAIKLSWCRPASVPYPITWSTFVGKDLDKGDNMVEYEIRDLTPDKFDDAFQLMANDFLKNEPIHNFFGNFLYNLILHSQATNFDNCIFSNL